MRIYVVREARELEHDPEELGPLITAATLGNTVERYLLDRTSPFSMLIEKARADFLSAQLTLLNSDLTTTAGLERAKTAQRHARYYVDLCNYIAETLEEGAAADQQIDRTDEGQAVEELKDQLHGERRDKPARDS